MRPHNWPPAHAYARALKACTQTRNLEEGKKIHARALLHGLGSNALIRNALISLYAECACLPLARRVFDETPKRDVLSWTLIVSAYAKHGDVRDALGLFEQMQWEGLNPNEITLVTALKACAKLGDPKQARRVHDCVKAHGFESNLYVCSCLIHVYVKCGCLEDARKVFNGMREGQRNVVCWTSMIAGYTQYGHGREALALFKEMRRTGVKPDRHALACALKACAILADIKRGRRIHQIIEKNDLETDIVIGNSLIDMYAKCGSMENARRAFDQMRRRDVVTWNAVISGYALHGLADDALATFQEMQVDGVKPDKITFASILKVCGSLANVEEGKKIHSSIEKERVEIDLIGSNSLIDMYVKCGSMEDARRVFNGMSDHNVVSWTTLIAGYAQHGHSREALALFERMQSESVKPNEITFGIILKTCAGLAALEVGKKVHESIKMSGYEMDLGVGNGLIDMYAKCGSIEDARQVFDDMNFQGDVVSWNTMIAGYAHHGHGKEALDMFEKMQMLGVKANAVTFISVLSACSHEGMVDEARRIFELSSQDDGIILTVEHYACMVDLLGRLGHLVEAEDFINKMPIQPSVSIWRTMLGACKMHGNIELGRRVFERIREMEPENAAAYVVLSNMYAAVGRWDEAAKLRKEMDEVGLKTNLG